MPRPERRLAVAAGLGLGLVLAVVVAAAGIRLGIAVPGLRIVHRVAASLEVIVVLWLAWMAWRHPAVLFALALSAALSLIGIAAGQNPPPAAAAANLLGGLALAAAFAWLLGSSGRGAGTALAWTAGVLLALQLGLGAWLAVIDRTGAALPLHGVLAMALAGLLAWLALARVGGNAGRTLFALAIAAPVAGASALQYDHSAVAALVHAVAAAALLVLMAFVLGARLTHIKGS